MTTSGLSGASQARGPVLVKGALVSTDPGQGTPSSVVFQYNPGTLRRSLKPQMTGGEPGDRSELVRFTGAAVETITVDIEIDGLAADARMESIAPQLAALELLAYPTTTDVTARQQLLAQGVIEVTPLAAPTLHFVWGTNRVLPVRIESIEVTEESFDDLLQPIQATVGLTMRVLTYSDVAPDVDAYHTFLAHQANLERLAAQASGNAAATGVPTTSI